MFIFYLFWASHSSWAAGVSCSLALEAEPRPLSLPLYRRASGSSSGPQQARETPLPGISARLLLSHQAAGKVENRDRPCVGLWLLRQKILTRGLQRFVGGSCEDEELWRVSRRQPPAPEVPSLKGLVWLFTPGSPEMAGDTVLSIGAVVSRYHPWTARLHGDSLWIRSGCPFTQKTSACISVSSRDPPAFMLCHHIFSNNGEKEPNLCNCYLNSTVRADI